MQLFKGHNQNYRFLLISFFLSCVKCRNDDVFNYGFSDIVETGSGQQGVRSFGQQTWKDVTCDNKETCTGFSDNFPFGKGEIFHQNSNYCRWCPESGPDNACGLHRQSPIDLKRNRAVLDSTDEKECPDWHFMHYLDDTCSWDDMKDQFKIARHALQIEIPQLPNGDIDCVENGERRYPRLDYSKGFPDWFWMQRTEIMIPSQHFQEGHQYAAEVVLSHFYEIEHPKNQLGNVAIFLQDYPNVSPWPYLDKLICQWRKEEEKVRSQCGLPPASPYGRCALFRGQEPTSEWLAEMAGHLFPKTTSAPVNPATGSPIQSKTSSPSIIQYEQTPAPVVHPIDPTAQASVPFTSQVFSQPFLLPVSYAPASSPLTNAPISTNAPLSASTHVPTGFPNDNLTPAPTTFPVFPIPPPHNCNDRQVNYQRVCHSSDPCCEPIRSDSEYCWDVYDKLGDSIESACFHCCDEPKIIGPKAPMKEGLPLTIKCSDIEDTDRMCRPNSCCTDPRSESEFCLKTYNMYSDQIMKEICHYCCRVPSTVGTRRQLKFLNRVKKSNGSDVISAVPSRLHDSDVPSRPHVSDEPPVSLSIIPVPTPKTHFENVNEIFASFTNISSSSTINDLELTVELNRNIPPPINCSDGRVPYTRMCDAIEPCCEATRSDTSFCWHIYDVLGAAVPSACYHCCETPKIVGPEAPPKSSLPKTLSCSKIENSRRICNSCCTSPRSTLSYCQRQYEFYSDNELAEICHYCCSRPQSIGSSKRVLRGENSLYLKEVNILPTGAKLYEVGGKKYLIREENFLLDDIQKDEQLYFEKIYSSYKKRTLQDASTSAFLEDYLDVEYWPYEWLVKVGTEYYFRYEGTEVIPPCMEVAHWRMLKDPIKVNKRQIDELSRLLAWRLNPGTCASDTAGVKYNNDNMIKANRELQYYHKQHRMVFCECKDWPSKFPGDKEWCDNWERDVNYDRFFTYPYSFDTKDTRWLP